MAAISSAVSASDEKNCAAIIVRNRPQFLQGVFACAASAGTSPLPDAGLNRATGGMGYNWASARSALYHVCPDDYTPSGRSRVVHSGSSLVAHTRSR